VHVLHMLESNYQAIMIGVYQFSFAVPTPDSNLGMTGQLSKLHHIWSELSAKKSSLPIG